MAGGGGSRFWPVSRKERPKQFLDILGTGKTFLRATYERFAPIVDEVLVVTNEAYADLVLEQLPELKPEHVLGEPVGRNTAPCVAWAAHKIARENPQADMIVTPADHLVLDVEGFRKTLLQALDFVEGKDAMMTIGIEPTGPNTGYGYIQAETDDDKSRENLHRKTGSGIGRNFRRERRIFVECGYLHIQCTDISERFAQTSAGYGRTIRLSRTQ